jgi:hypothetical protein
MLAKGYGASQAIKDVSEHRRSAFDFVSAIADAMTDKTSFADSDRPTNFSLSQHINLPILTLMSFIVASAWVTS